MEQDTDRLILRDVQTGNGNTGDVQASNKRTENMKMMTNIRQARRTNIATDTEMDK